MVVDIFPAIDIPVVAVIWNYPGLSAQDMERRVVLISERAFSTTVNGIERIESQSIPGIGMLKIYFQPGAEIGAAIAQISSVTSTILRIAPPGMTPPTIIQFNASNVPVAQVTLSSETLPEQQIFDYGLNFIRVRLFTIPGLSTPAPFGGKQRQINVDIDPRALSSKGLSPFDVVNALNTSNVILPAGTARIGSREYNVLMNSSPSEVAEFARIPVKIVDGAPVMLGDVARISDSFADQTNLVRVNGRRATYLAILKHSDASTLAVVDAVRDALPQIKAAAPNGLELNIDFDQSVFVRGAIGGVVREAVISSILVSLMVGLFLGSWRSMVIVCTSIPLAIFSAIVGLKLTGNTINIMTLGGLALAIGMLVDDATVEVENIHRNRNMGKPLTRAILDGAQQIAVPAIVATLSICIVFFPVVLLVGPARFLFTPLAIAVVLAMLASYLLSRTLVPALARMLMRSEHHHLPGTDPGPPPRGWAGVARRFNDWRDARFDRFQNGYARLLGVALAHRRFTIGDRRRDRAGQLRARVGGRDRLLSVGRRRPDEAALPRAGRLPHRKDRRADHPGRKRPARDHPGSRDLDDQRHDRRAGLVQPGVRPDGQRQPDGRRDPDRAQARPRAQPGVHAPDPPDAGRALSRRHLVLPAGRHRQPGAELRAVGADRRAGRASRTFTRRTRSRSACAPGSPRCPAPPTRTSCRSWTTRR